MYTEKPNCPRVSTKSDITWSVSRGHQKPGSRFLLSCKSHEDLIWIVNYFLIFISFLPPPTCCGSPSHVLASLSRAIHIHRLPTAGPTTWKAQTLPSDLLVQGSHSSSAGSRVPDTQGKVSPGFLLQWFLLSLWPSDKEKTLHYLQMLQNPGPFFCLTFSYIINL